MAVNINIPSQVSQTITDGVTDKAPSENAVHDALALKANSTDLGATAFSNDYNDLDNLPSIPSAQVNSDWNATSGVAEILNKPTIPTSLPPSGAAGGDLNGNYPNPTVDGIHGIDMQSGTPTSGDVWVYGGSPAKWQHQMLHASQVDNDSAVTGTHVSDALNHLDTTKEPSITAGTTAQYWRGDKSWQTLNKSAVGLGNVDNTSDLNKPISTATQTALNAKQDSLVSGTNIKTVNSNSLLGSGNVAVQDVLVSGTNIKTINGNSILGSGDITVGGGITIGTTAITSGTVGRILFEGTGNVVQQSAGLTFNNGEFTVKTGTSTRFIVGNDPTFKVFNLCDSVYNNGFTTYLKAPSGASPQVECSGNGLILNSSFVTSLSASNQIQITTNGIVRSFYDSNGNVGIGSMLSLGARLDVRAQGALSTDIAFRVRNSADTANLIESRGNGTHIISDGTWGITINNTTANHLVSGNIAFSNIIDIRNNITHTNGVSDISFRTTQAPLTNGYALNPYYERFVFGATVTSGFGTGNPSRFIGIVNGTAPNGVITDSFAFYSADIVAGNAAPHFRTENGSIIKLFQGAALTASDGTLANAVTRIGELEARLKAHGLIA